jgi:NAD(P)-dependent dehydrogenase (short-subunit alcohol dehydrogenase family)
VRRDPTVPVDKTALVVGASRGLGLGLAAELRRRGWDVVGTVRDDAGARRVEALGARVERVDIADREAVAALRRRLGGVVFDLVFVNAGIQGPAHQDPAQATAAEIGELFLVNAVAPVRVAQAVFDLVRDGAGVVAFMSSDLGSVSGNTDGYLALYRASKAALNSLVRSFAAGLGARRVTVLAVHPGWVRTDMGGGHAPLAVGDSVRGIIDVVERRAGTLHHGFVDHRGRELAW